MRYETSNCYIVICVTNNDMQVQPGTNLRENMDLAKETRHRSGLHDHGFRASDEVRNGVVDSVIAFP